MIPPFRPLLGGAEFRALMSARRGSVARFEAAFARAFDAREAVAFAYGRSALVAFLGAVGLEGAEVVMPAYTCSVVAHATVRSGNRPVFVDIRPRDFNMDLERLPDAITPRTGAVVATHLFGYPLELDRVEAIVADAERRFGRRIWLVQDCAHAFGARFDGRLVSASGDVALYGLNVSKLITSIFGGMLTFSDPALAARVRAWRDAHATPPAPFKALRRRAYLAAAHLAFTGPVYGLTRWLQDETSWLDSVTRSYHLDERVELPPDAFDRMLDVEAAVGCVQLDRYDEIVRRRRAHAAFYDRVLESTPSRVLPPLVEGATYSHYVVRVPDRARCVARLAADGIRLGELIQYCVPDMAPYRGTSGPTPHATQAARSTVNLPVQATLTDAQRARVAERFAAATA